TRCSPSMATTARAPPSPRRREVRLERREDGAWGVGVRPGRSPARHHPPLKLPGDVLHRLSNLCQLLARLDHALAHVQQVLACPFIARHEAPKSAQHFHRFLDLPE